MVTHRGQNHPEEVVCPWSPKARVGAMLLVVMAEAMEVLTALKAREGFLAALAVKEVMLAVGVLAFPAALVAVVEMLVAAVMASLVALVVKVVMLAALAFPAALVAAVALVVPHPFVAPF